jgi:hypothetical protein
VNPLLTRAQELLDLGIKAEKRGLYSFASIRYIQIWESLFSLVALREANLIALSSREETVLFNIFHMIKTRLRDVTAKMTNGSPSMSGRKNRDSPREAFETVLREMEEFM